MDPELCEPLYEITKESSSPPDRPFPTQQQNAEANTKNPEASYYSPAIDSKPLPPPKPKNHSKQKASFRKSKQLPPLPFAKATPRRMSYKKPLPPIPPLKKGNDAPLPPPKPEKYRLSWHPNSKEEKEIRETET
eukprot:TRINITY_DN1643_c0_g1_i1.p1 TRINITY_DN1643_c0_g1~~TRINITY_DN1643_c0_g1_i1.p1  ORF type:complete len:134 (+),score=39.89 TRINITY_DN1643_c0_g1_i1:51-452(+)